MPRLLEITGELTRFDMLYSCVKHQNLSVTHSDGHSSYSIAMKGLKVIV